MLDLRDVLARDGYARYCCPMLPTDKLTGFLLDPLFPFTFIW